MIFEQRSASLWMIFSRFGLNRARGGEEELGKTDDAGERVIQLVRDAGDQLSDGRASPPGRAAPVAGSIHWPSRPGAPAAGG